MGDEPVLQALKRTTDNGKAWTYAVGILKKMAKESIIHTRIGNITLKFIS